MFEQSVVQEGRGARRSAVTLPVSIALHAVAISSALFAAVWQVDFPLRSPDQYQRLILDRPVDVPAGSPSRPKAPPKPQATAPKIAQVQQTPTVIPDEVRPVEAPTGPADAPVDPTAEGPGSGDEIGVGNSNGPGLGDAVEGEPPRPVGGDVKAPVNIFRVDPPYPPAAAKMRLNGFVIVTAIIDEHGNVINASVLKSTHPLFEQPAINAVQRWKYKPGTLYGRAISTIFNLTVSFQIKN
jgi:TonB family protein